MVSKKNVITILVVFKAAAMIMSYPDDMNYSSLYENELEHIGIFDDLIYRTLISLIHTCYFNNCKLIKKSPDFLEILLSD